MEVKMKHEIIRIMSAQHDFIRSALGELESSWSKDSVKSSEPLNIFVWNLEKHIFLEEKILYSVYSVWDGNIEGMFEILEDHSEIMAFMKKMKTGNFDKIDIASLRELLEDHFVLEETIFYPSLEKVLNLDQKNIILERAQEILRG
jgi:hypothetical protein